MLKSMVSQFNLENVPYLKKLLIPLLSDLILKCIWIKEILLDKLEILAKKTFTQQVKNLKILEQNMLNNMVQSTLEELAVHHLLENLLIKALKILSM